MIPELTGIQKEKIGHFNAVLILHAFDMGRRRMGVAMRISITHRQDILLRGMRKTNRSMGGVAMKATSEIQGTFRLF